MARAGSCEEGADLAPRLHRAAGFEVFAPKRERLRLRLAAEQPPVQVESDCRFTSERGSSAEGLEKVPPSRGSSGMASYGSEGRLALNAALARRRSAVPPHKRPTCARDQRRSVRPPRRKRCERLSRIRAAMCRAMVRRVGEGASHGGGKAALSTGRLADGFRGGLRESPRVQRPPRSIGADAGTRWPARPFCTGPLPGQSYREHSLRLWIASTLRQLEARHRGSAV
jgi:hypothetical protein